MFSFYRWIYKFPVRATKHNASKKNYTHIHNLSKGELNHQKFLARVKINQSPNINEYMNYPILLEESK